MCINLLIMIGDLYLQIRHYIRKIYYKRKRKQILKVLYLRWILRGRPFHLWLKKTIHIKKEDSSDESEESYIYPSHFSSESSEIPESDRALF